MATPDDTPSKLPDVAPMLATVVGITLHVPPPVMSVSVITDPMHTLVAPDIVAGTAFTVIVLVTLQPALDV